MQQTKLESLVETCINTLIGFALSYIAWPIAAWLFTIPYSPGSHFGVVMFFTVISVARGYVVRRWFNARLHKMAIKIASKL